MTSILIKPGHKASRMLAAKNRREHKRYHLNRAEEMRAEAAKIESAAESLTHDLMGDITRQAMQDAAQELRFKAIEEENLKCIEGH